MCGIAGIVDYEEGTKRAWPYVDAIKQTMGRRGPDQDGEFLTEQASFIHTRLSVVDLENGKQPMRLEYNGQEYIIAYNGEIYNAQELTNELKSKGHHFTSHSDTEALLHAYCEWKEGCVSRLNGIFAFAVWETKQRRLFVARDRIGVKPFFFINQGTSFIFASEIKTLFKFPGVSASLNEEGLCELILLGPARTPGQGVFSGVKELKRAQCGYLTEKGLDIWEYWKLNDTMLDYSFEETTQKVRGLVTDSIERQLSSDVEVGCFLSGGLDSSAISSVASSYFKQRGKKLKTFSVDYRDNSKYFTPGKFQPNSDSEYIGDMASYIDSEHHNIILDTEELAEALYSAVDARDLPGMADVDSSLLLFCKEVKKEATVVLSGECADETGCSGGNTLAHF